MKVQAMTETLHDEQITLVLDHLPVMWYMVLESPCWSAECAHIMHKKPFKVTN